MLLCAGASALPLPASYFPSAKFLIRHIAYQQGVGHRDTLIQQFDYFIKHSASGRRRTPSGKKIAEGTITGYRHVLLLLKEYEQENKIQICIQLLHRASLRTLKREKNYWSRFFVSFSHFLFRKKGYYDNYVSSVFKTIKTFFNYLQNDKGYITGNYQKLFRIPVQQATPVVISPRQLQFLIANKEFESSLNKYQKRARDIFVFGCTVALRVSDLMNLEKTNVICIESKTFLSVFTQKTGAEVRIPLPEYAVEIIQRYKRKAGRHLLPRLSVSNLNIQIKKLIKQAGWDNPLPKNISLHGRMIELKTDAGSSWPFYKHITAHTMRRTAITTLLILGVPENIVRKISGHAPGSKEFYKYVGLAQDYVNQEVSKAYQKLIELPANPTAQTCNSK
jgi:integrase